MEEEKGMNGLAGGTLGAIREGWKQNRNPKTPRNRLLQ